MAEGLGSMALAALFTFIFSVSQLTFSSALTDDLDHDFDRYLEALRENRVKLTELSQPTTYPIVEADKPADSRILDLFCYESTEKLTIQNVWTSVCFELSLKERRYEVYSGTNESHVFQLFEREAAANWRSFFSHSSHEFCFIPFEKACIGIYTVRSYKLNLTVQDFDSWLVGCTLCGVLLFLFASYISRSTIFYYVAGIVLGVVMSFMFIFIFVGRFFTKKFTVMVVSLAAGSSLTLWFMKWLWVNLQMALEFYSEYLVGYLVFSALLSFSVCYYFGPSTNERLLNLIKWFLQGVAATMIYSGIQSITVSYAVIGVLVFAQVTASFWH